MASDTVTTTTFSGTASTDGATYNGTLPSGVLSNNQYGNGFGPSSLPVKIVSHNFKCDLDYSYASAPTHVISALEPWRYYIVSNVIATEPVWGRTTEIEFEVWHLFTNNNIPVTQGDKITFTSCPKETSKRVDTHGGGGVILDDGDDDAGLLIPVQPDPGSLKIYGAELGDASVEDGTDYETRVVKVNGEPLTAFSIALQDSDGNYYNFESNIFSSIPYIFRGLIPSDSELPGLIPGIDYKRGVFILDVDLPRPADGVLYTLVLNPDATTVIQSTPFVDPDSNTDNLVTKSPTTAVKTVAKASSTTPIFTLSPVWAESSGVSFSSNKEFSLLAVGQTILGDRLGKEKSRVSKDIFISSFVVTRSGGGLSIVAGDLNSKALDNPALLFSGIVKTKGSIIELSNGWIFDFVGIKTQLVSNQVFNLEVQVKLLKTGTKNATSTLDISSLLTHS
jgi:hypothetical protein